MLPGLFDEIISITGFSIMAILPKLIDVND